MRLLLRYLWSGPRAFVRFLICGVALLLLSVSTQMEICVLGLVGDQSTDLFRLFGAEKELSLEEVQQRWVTLAPSGVLTREAAQERLAGASDGNPLKWILKKVQAVWQFRQSVEDLVLVLCVVACAKALSTFLARYSIQHFSIRTSAWMRYRLYAHLQHLPLHHFEDRAVGGLAARIVQDTAAIAAAGPALLHNLLQLPVVVLSGLAICWSISWQLSLAVIVGLPVVLGPALWLNQRLRRTQHKVLSHQEGLLQHLVDWLHGLTTVRLLNLEREALERYAEKNDHLKAVERRGALFGQLGRPVLHITATMVIGCVVLGGFQLLHLSFGSLLVFAGMMMMLYEPLKRYAEESQHVQKGAAAAQRLEELLAQPLLPAQGERKAVHPLQDRLRFDRVSFAYRPGVPVLKEVSFEIPRGQMVAIVGPTGAGKSTLAHLLLGLYPPSSGQLYWDELPYEELSIEQLRHQIAIVPQRPFLFQASVRENLLFGVQATEAELHAAAEQARAASFIAELPQGYATMLGEQGKSLSGGQLQRLAIARALLRRSSLLVLDEATSSVDTVSEAAIQQALRTLHGQQTLVVIAHRLSTIAEADHIIVLDQGSVVGMGTLGQLLESNATFQQLWQAGQRATPLSV